MGFASVIGVVFVAVGAALVTLRPSGSNDTSNSIRRRPSVKVFSEQELARYKGTGGNPIYIAILGRVYDVTAGSRFYGPDAGEYHYFAGRDGTKTFVTGDGFGKNEEGVPDDHNVRDFPVDKMSGIDHWLKFYEEKYKFVGVLHMTSGESYYDEDGNPTALHQLAEEKFKEMRKLQKQQEDLKEKYPHCNSRWAQNEGGKIWCTDGNVPRKATLGGSERCACVDPKEAVTNANFQVYPNCDAKSAECAIDP